MSGSVLQSHQETSTPLFPQAPYTQKTTQQVPGAFITEILRRKTLLLDLHKNVKNPQFE